MNSHSPSQHMPNLPPPIVVTSPPQLEALLDELQPTDAATGMSLAERQALIDLLLGMSQRGADAYFGVFFQGLTPEMIDLDDISAQLNGEGRLGSLIDGGRALGQEPPPPSQRPGRNDPY